MNTEKFKSIFKRMTKSKNIYEATLLIENGDGSFSFNENYGDKDIDSPIIIASITKILTASCILILKEKGCLSLTDKVVDYFAPNILKGLHILKDKEYTDEITIIHLLTQSSGLPDESEESFQKSFIKEILLGDLEYSFEDLISKTKELKPHFPPQLGRKAYYSNTNFDILGKIIEKVTNLPLNQAFSKYIFEPLRLNNTYLPISTESFIPSIYYKNNKLYRPKTVISSAASGGVVSTTRELMVLLKAFFQGTLFDRSCLNDFPIYKRIQFSFGPIRYGFGHMQIPLGGLITMFQGKGELIGHSGSTGSFAFFHPETDLYFVGDLNQMAKPAYTVRLVIQLALVNKNLDKMKK